jgi:hypothetical protein
VHFTLISSHFEAKYGQPLPARLRFDPETGFSRLADYMQVAAQNQPSSVVPRVNSSIATYKTAKTKKSLVESHNISEEEKEEYHRGAPISTATKGWRASGTIGLVTSGLSSASAQSQGEND